MSEWESITLGRVWKQMGDETVELIRWDPKDGELSVPRLKGLETGLEGRVGVDVQITRLRCV